MLSHLLSKLLTPKAAEWGRLMSVGVVVICADGKGVVGVSDMKATFGNFSADYAALKGRRIYRRWYAIYAGDDVEYAPDIIARATNSLGDDEDEPLKRVEEVVAALDDAYWSVIHAQIEARVLRKQKFTVDSFRETGSKKCTPTIYNNLCAKIDKVEISLQFLLYGFSENGTPSIFLVDGREAPKCYDEVGVWAIGSGSQAALSSLAFHIDHEELSKTTPIERAVYFACEAKYMAESSGHVGRDVTIIAIHRMDDELGKTQVLYERSATSAIKRLWKTEGAPRVPPNIEERMKNIFDARLSTSQTSESEQ